MRNYAMSVSRWIQCEHAISEYGFLAKHPTTGQTIKFDDLEVNADEQ